MSVLALLVAGATPLAPVLPTPEVAQEIVVMGKKLKGWKGGVSKVGGRMVCKTRKSSGDKALDAIRCGAMLNCMKPLEPRIDTLMGSTLAPSEKKTRFAALMSAAFLGEVPHWYHGAAFLLIVGGIALSSRR